MIFKSMSYELSQCIAPLPPVERGKSVIIGGDPKGKNFLYCSGKGTMLILDVDFAEKTVTKPL